MGRTGCIASGTSSPPTRSCLSVGALTALVWANLDPGSYHRFVDYPLIEGFFIGHAHIDVAGHLHRTLTIHYLVNDVLMALFFAIAAKEVWEAVILRERRAARQERRRRRCLPRPEGWRGRSSSISASRRSLARPPSTRSRKAGQYPTATDIAFSYLVGRIVFGGGHPAVRFLLLLAIADDAAGLIILAVFYPSADIAPEWLLLSVGTALAAFVLFNWLPRRLDRGDELRRELDMGAGTAVVLALRRGRRAQLVRLSRKAACTPPSACCRSFPPSRTPTARSASSRRPKPTLPTCSTSSSKCSRSRWRSSSFSSG